MTTTGAELDSTLQTVLACVRDELQLLPCTACVVVGAPALDGCCDQGTCSGQLTVHLVSLVPVDDQLRRRAATVTPCRPQTLGVDLRVTLARCHPTLGISGQPPGCPELAAAAAQLSEDVAAVQRGLACCPLPAAVTSVDVTQPPSGGCAVVTAAAVVELSG